jgi:hypothetical protein
MPLNARSFLIGQRPYPFAPIGSRAPAVAATHVQIIVEAVNKATLGSYIEVEIPSVYFFGCLAELYPSVHLGPRKSMG